MECVQLLSYVQLFIQMDEYTFYKMEPVRIYFLQNINLQDTTVSSFWTFTSLKSRYIM